MNLSAEAWEIRCWDENDPITIFFRLLPAGRRNGHRLDAVGFQRGQARTDAPHRDNLNVFFRIQSGPAK
jgi:hypothetical protein